MSERAAAAAPSRTPAPASLWSLVLAAGEGTRMKSDLPKVLHEAMGRPMLAWVLDAARGAGAASQIVVVGYGAERVEAAVAAPDVRFVHQRERLGTGHAVMIARALLEEFAGSLLVLAGDTPLIEARTLSRLAGAHSASGAAATILSARFPNPTGYGRIVRSPDGDVLSIREELDASPAEKAIDEINTGAYCFETRDLLEALAGLRADNAKNEYYLTDTIAILIAAGRRVEAVVAGDYKETLGVNTREALAEADALLRERRSGAVGKRGT